MLVYTANKATFVEHVRQNQIEERILEAFISRLKRKVQRNEIASWKNSMQYMKNVLDTPAIPEDAGVSIEYTIPQTTKRIDFILTGMNHDKREVAVIVELKQWEKVKKTDKDAIVETYVGSQEREVAHPSYQAWTYAALLQDFNETVQLDNIDLRPCAYLHNCISEEIILDEFYAEHIERAPCFLKKDVEKLQRFLSQNVKYGDSKDIMYRIDHGKIKPSKSLADHLASLLQGNKEFIMIDDQKVIYEKALELAKASQTDGKQVYIVEGGPGTGKSVLAVNLLVELTSNEQVAQYVTKNSAPRTVFQSLLTGTMKKTRITNLFKGSGAYTESDSDVFDALIVDEAHRLNEKSGMMSNLGVNQIKEIINAAKLSIFFLDEDQRVTFKDIGEKSEIEKWANLAGATIHYGELLSQFRCNGSDGYLTWLDNTLELRETANETLEGIDYNFQVVNSPVELRDKIYAANIERNRARIVAGYCWDWISKKDKKDFDITFKEHNFAMRWNLSDDGMGWIIKPNSVSEIGCIHTCQGLELDYVGVIIGPDLIVRDGKVVTDALARSKMDSSVKGFKTLLKKDSDAALKKAELIIKNTYRTLMSRGAKGCFIWCVDPETNEYFRNCLGERNQIEAEDKIKEILPFEIMNDDDVVPFENSVPLFDIRAAAGSFSNFQDASEFRWVKLPSPFNPAAGIFVVQVVGESMNRRIPNGSWCLFRHNPEGSREGKIVLVQHRDIQDADHGGQYTVKRYYSEKQRVGEGDGEWRHERIVLRPESSDGRYEDIVLAEDGGRELVVVGEFVAVVG